MTFGAAQTSAGKIYKYYNLKWTLLVSMLVFEVSSLICGVASSSKTLIIGRAIAGLWAAPACRSVALVSWPSPCSQQSDP